MITGINESKLLTRDISCEFKCKFDGKKLIQVNDGIMINVDANVKKFMFVKKIMFGILLHVILKVGNIDQVLWMIQLLFVMKL